MSDSEQHKGWLRWFRWLWQTEKYPDKASYYQRESEYHESQCEQCQYGLKDRRTPSTESRSARPGIPKLIT